jgi:ABC-2 type transport system permease protein
MKPFLMFIKKEFLHIFRDRRTLLILFGMPIVQIILFGFAITNEIKNAKIAILNPSKDYLTEQIQNKLLSSGYFQLERNLTSYKEIEGAFQDGQIKMAVVFPADFADDFSHLHRGQVQIIVDASDPNMANTLTNYASAIIKGYEKEITEAGNNQITIQPEVKMLFNPELKGVFMFVPGVMTLILMLVSAMMTSIAITREKELGTMDILLVSPLKPSLIIIGKVIPYLLLSFINAIIIILMGVLIFQMPIHGSVLLLIAECMLFIFTSLTLGILISTRTSTQQTAMMISMMGLLMPTMLLSGFIFPIESMPMPLQLLSNIIPAKWFIIIIKDIMLKGLGFGFIWKETAILLLMTLFFIGVSIKNFKIRLS